MVLTSHLELMVPSGSLDLKVSHTDGMASPGLRSVPRLPPELLFNPMVAHGSPLPTARSSDGIVSTGKR